MRHTRRWRRLAYFLVIAGATNFSSHAYFSYQLEALGHLGGGSSRASAMNDEGWVVGESVTEAGDVHAFIWRRGAGMQSLGTLGGSGSRAHDVNQEGRVVGESTDTNGVLQAFVWTEAGGMRALPVPARAVYSAAFAVNDDGVIVGTMEDERGVHAVAWEDGEMRYLNRLPGAGHVQPLDLNADGDVVGLINIGEGEEQSSLAYYFAGGAMASNLVDFRLVSAQSGSAAVAINDAGMAAGYVMLDTARVRAFRVGGAGGLELLPDRDSLFSTATDINEQGWITGSRVADFAADESACLWRDDRCLDLNDVVERGTDWWLVQGVGINEKGEIAGHGTRAEASESFILRPIRGDAAAWPALLLSVEVPGADDGGSTRYLVLRADVPQGLDIKEVLFFAGDELLGSVDVPPYEWGWEGSRDMDISFHAVLKEASGRSTASSRVMSPREPVPLE